MIENRLGTRGASVDIKELCKWYQGVAAATNISLRVAPGEFLTFLGPSGSGKTTTLKMIAGLETPSNGDILIDDRSIVHLPVHKRSIGMVFQNYALFPHMTVSRNVAFPLEMRRIDKRTAAEKVARALDLVHLSGYEHRRPVQLSGGQQQRVALARAMVFEPSVLLLDEPLGALDAKLREAMKVELKALHQKIGTTIIFVTHDQEEALTLSDRIAVFNEGCLTQVGTPRALYERPANHFVADFIGETNFLSGRLVNERDDGCRIRLDETIEVHAPPAPRAGGEAGRATYTLRLEKLAIGESAGSRANRFEGVIEESFYLGDAIKYRLRLSPSIHLTAKVAERRNSARLGVGDRVAVGWDSEDMRPVMTE